MTATISMPRELYEQATAVAQSMGISQRRFFIAAVREYLHSQKVADMQSCLNEIHKNHSPDDFDTALESSGIETLRELTKNDAW